MRKWRNPAAIEASTERVRVFAGTAPKARKSAAGLIRRAYLDSTRQAWSGGAPRPLVTLVFYPTPEPLFSAGVIVPGAPVSSAEAGFPLIILSHGTGGSAAQLAWLATALAKRGYIAAAVNHHGNTGAEPRPDARGFLLWWERARDALPTSHNWRYSIRWCGRLTLPALCGDSADGNRVMLHDSVSTMVDRFFRAVWRKP